MKKSIIKYAFPVIVGMVLLIITATAFISTTITGCIKEDTPSSGGCGTQMGCCPATGCGRNWLGNVTQLCYATANACTSAGNNRCTQCY